MPLTSYTAGDVLTAASLNANLAVAAGGQKAVFNETQAAGTQSGASVASSFQKRTLNTTVVNTITGCTLTSSVIELPAGTYTATAFAPFHDSESIKIRLRNTSDNTDAIMGVTGFSGNEGTFNAVLQGVFTIAATKNFELQYYVSLGQLTNGLGQRLNVAGIDEVYATIEIVQIA